MTPIKITRVMIPKIHSGGAYGESIPGNSGQPIMMFKYDGELGERHKWWVKKVKDGGKGMKIQKP